MRSRQTKWQIRLQRETRVWNQTSYLRARPWWLRWRAAGPGRQRCSLGSRSGWADWPPGRCRSQNVQALRFWNIVILWKARRLWKTSDFFCGKLWDCDKCCVTSSHGRREAVEEAEGVSSQQEMVSLRVKLAPSCPPRLDLITVISQNCSHKPGP